MAAERRLTEEQAQQIWRRAAELQASAAERADLRRRTVTAGTVLAADGLAITDVREAAVEAGIGEEFVESAIAELDNERDLRPRPGSLLARAANKLLDDPPYVLTVTGELPGTADAAFASMQRVFPHAPFNLLLRDTRGAELFVDGLLIFEVSYDSAHIGFQRKVAAAGIERLFVTLRSVREHADRCEVTVRAPVGRLGLNVLLSGGFTGLGGGVGAAAGAAAGPSLAGLIHAGGLIYTSIIGSAAVISGVAFGGIVLAGYRALHDRALHRASDALGSLVQALAVDVRTKGAFAPRSRVDQTFGRVDG